MARGLAVALVVLIGSAVAAAEPVQLTPEVCLGRLSQFLASSPGAAIPDQVHRFAAAFDWAKIIEQEAEDSIDWSLYRRPAECERMKSIVAQVEAQFECAAEIDYEEPDVQKTMFADPQLAQFWFANLACSLSDNTGPRPT